MTHYEYFIRRTGGGTETWVNCTILKTMKKTYLIKYYNEFFKEYTEVEVDKQRVRVAK